jgi:hypothetical protein
MESREFCSGFVSWSNFLGFLLFGVFRCCFRGVYSYRLSELKKKTPIVCETMGWVVLYFWPKICAFMLQIGPGGYTMVMVAGRLYWKKFSPRAFRSAFCGFRYHDDWSEVDTGTVSLSSILSPTLKGAIDFIDDIMHGKSLLEVTT